MEGDVFACNRILAVFAFLSTPSGWRATTIRYAGIDYGVRISIHALRVEGDYTGRNGGDAYFSISIHALRVEGDSPIENSLGTIYVISIHALRVEGDLPKG